MRRHLARQLWLMVTTLVGVSTLVFLIMRATPGDPARLMLGDFATPEALAQLRAQLGLDRPLGEAYLGFLQDYARGDLGTSLSSRRPVIDEIAARAPYTLQLALAAMGFAVAVGLPLGMLAAVKRNSLLDHASMLAAIVGGSTPVFFLGLVLILVFAVHLRWLPAIGVGNPGDAVSLARALILPSLAVGAPTATILARMTRSSTLEVLGQEYIRTARAKGLAELAVLARHALKNASIPLVTVVALNVGYLVGGAVIIETVFARPGLGKLLVDAILFRDYPVVQGVAFVIAASFIVINALTDLSYVWLDPRIKYR